MKVNSRPEHIKEILNSLDTSAEMTTELEKYIVDLEAKQPHRPPKINRFLEDVESHYSAEVKDSLESYISELEANQQPIMPGSARSSTESLYWRSVRREKERKIRALRKQSYKPTKNA